MEAFDVNINRHSIANDTFCAGSAEFAGFYHTHAHTHTHTHTHTPELPFCC